jgi:tetratricopeptide (TPR) repeat protein
MSKQQSLPISVQPVISYPREAQVGKTYLMTVDLRLAEGAEWLFEEEEYPVYCMVDSEPLFRCEAVGEPAIVLHRFGGSYGAAEFLLTASITELDSQLKISLINAWGIPVKIIRLSNIKIKQQSNLTQRKYETDGLRFRAIPTRRVTSIPQNLPRSGSTRFIGHEDDLVQIHDLLQQREQCSIISIQGMGGIGKTELALQYALSHYHLGTYPGGICWLRARDQQIGTQIITFAQNSLGLILPDGTDLIPLVQFCWLNWREGDVLIIVDDVTELGTIRDYLPSEERFKVLMTTRSHLGSSIRTLAIEALTPIAAMELLASLVTDGRVERERTDAEVMCEWLGYLPLGLELVGRYLATKPDVSLAEVGRRLEMQRLQQRSLTDEALSMTAEQGIEAAFELSWQELDEGSRQLASILSVFALAPIPWAMVAKCIAEDEEPLEDFRDNLVEQRWIQRVGSGMYQLHLLTRQFFETKLKYDEERAVVLRCSVAETAARIAREIPRSVTLEVVDRVAPVLPHLEEVASQQEDVLTDDDLLWIFTGIAHFYEGQGFYSQAEPWYQDCLTVIKDRVGDYHPDVATSLNNLAELYRTQGRYEAAEPLYLQALQLREDLFGGRHPQVASSLNNLAGLYYSQGNYETAEPVLTKALQLFEDLFGGHHPDVVTILNNLAGLYNAQGRYEAAEPLLTEALQLRKDFFGNRHPDVANSLNNLGLLYNSQGRYEAAESLLSEALQLRKDIFGNRHPVIAMSLSNLAILYKLQGRYGDAEPLLREALQLCELLGDHAGVATSLGQLGDIEYRRSNWDTAEQLYRQALRIKEELGDRADMVASLRQLGDIERNRGDWRAAEELYRQLQQIREELGIKNVQFTEGYACVIGVGGDLPSTIQDAQGLASILSDPERCAYPPEHVQLLTGERAKREDVLAALDRLANSVKSDSTVIIYFSGHGYQFKSDFADIYYLMPYGYDRNRLKSNAISGSEFADRLKAIPAQKLLVLLDCCHAGGFSNLENSGIEVIKSPLPPESQVLFSHGHGRVIVASSRENEISLAGNPYSAFTAALIEALCGEGVAKQDGYVRVTDLALHTREVVPKRTRDRQHPILHFEQADNFVLAYYAGGDKQPKGLPFEGNLKGNFESVESQPRQVVQASDNRSVAIGGIANSATIITGSGNVVRSNNQATEEQST